MATVSINPPAIPPETAIPETSAVLSEPPVGRPEGVPYLLSADDYFRMVDADIIPTERRVGLWEGYLYEKMAKKMAHSGAFSKVTTALIRALPNEWCLWPENPILIDNFTAPLPDVSVVRGSPDGYTRRNSVPKAGEVGLVVELAESSLRKNLTTSLQVYARAGLPVYWVVNLVARRVQVYSGPRVEESGVASYSSVAMFEITQDVPLVLDGHEIARIPARDLIPEEAAST